MKEEDKIIEFIVHLVNNGIISEDTALVLSFEVSVFLNVKD